MNFTMCCPLGYEPDNEIATAASQKADEMNTTYLMEHDPVSAVKDADVVYSDVWTSMGQEDEATDRKRKFSNYQVNSELIAVAGNDCLVSHCLPAHRGEEITSEVLDGPQSVAFDEAENRLHVQKAILTNLLGI